jgi:hypothetical protein
VLAGKGHRNDWHVYNVIWMRDGLAIRRRLFADHAEAVAVAQALAS